VSFAFGIPVQEFPFSVHNLTEEYNGPKSLGIPIQVTKILENIKEYSEPTGLEFIEQRESHTIYLYCYYILDRIRDSPLVFSPAAHP